MGNAIQRYSSITISKILIKLRLIFCFLEKYHIVGKLLRCGEQPTNYEDEEDDTDREASKSNEQNNDEPSSLAEKILDTNSIIDEIQDSVMTKRNPVSNTSGTEELK